MGLIGRKFFGFYRILCWVLALHLLNYSIDPRDPDPIDIPENFSYHEIESIAELVLEVVFGLEGAFDDFDEHDTDNGDNIDAFKFICSTRSSSAIHHSMFLLDRKWSMVDDNQPPWPSIGIFVPPPKGILA